MTSRHVVQLQQHGRQSVQQTIDDGRNRSSSTAFPSGPVQDVQVQHLVLKHSFFQAADDSGVFRICKRGGPWRAIASLKKIFGWLSKTVPKTVTNCYYHSSISIMKYSIWRQWVEYLVVCRTLYMNKLIDMNIYQWMSSHAFGWQRLNKRLTEFCKF